MVRLFAATGVAGLLTLVAAGSAIPSPSRFKVSQVSSCKQLRDFRESPVQTLPASFQQGCAVSTPLRANNPGRIVYVLKAGLAAPFSLPKSGELTLPQTQTLDRLVDRGDALRVTWFRPATIGSQQFIKALPEETIFVAWDDLCTKFPSSQTVGCVESGALRTRQLAEILVRNREQNRP